MKISWLIVAAVVTVLCDVANAPDAFACGAPGQFGGCLSHGQFDSTINESAADPDGRFYRDPFQGESTRGYNPLKRASRAPHR
jgi:hypothetical protein